jgi:hypothetical protein
MNEPKYQISDRIPNSNLIVRGVMTTSKGQHRYFLQIFDNSLVINEDDLDLAFFQLKQTPDETG